MALCREDIDAHISVCAASIDIQVPPPHSPVSGPPASQLSDPDALQESRACPRKVHIAHVRFREGDDHLRLLLRICNDRKTFYRAVNERLDKLRHRLQILASQATEGAAEPFLGNRTRKQRNRADQFHCASSTIRVRFLTEENEEIEGKTVRVGDALRRTDRIVVGDETYVVLLNQPTVVSVAVVSPVLAGVPLVPLPEADFCEPDECTWRWFRVDEDGSEALVAGTRLFLPTDGDLGCRFRIECHAPIMHSHYAHESAAEAVTTPVVYGPDRAVFEERRRLGAVRAGPTASASTAFRVMTYNVLFDGYTSTLRSKAEVFPYAKHDVLEEMYRMQLVFQEIEEANADLVFMQEMGKKTFRSFFEPMMKPLGYHTVYTGKTGTTHEGCAMLVRRECFEVVEERTVAVSAEALKLDDPQVHALLDAYPELVKALKKIPSIAQLIALRDRRDRAKHLIVANTHLFYRDGADMIRLVQAVAIVRNIEQWKSELEALGHRVSVVFCGDLNAVPPSAAVSFLLEGAVDHTHRNWQHVAAFKWKLSPDAPDTASDSDLPIQSGSISHSLALSSACGIPEFTNFAGSFVATLDYILLGTRSLEVTQTFPLFTREQVTAETALPSTVFPSDHISLVADLQWKETSDRTSNGTILEGSRNR